jgi:predicted TIM-barrel fold metal-dependent hydrolase
MKIIDVHIYQGKWHWPLGLDTVADTIAVMDRCGIDLGVVMSVTSLAYDFREGNASLAEQLEGQRRVFGYVTVNGNYINDSIAQVKRYLGTNQFVGVKIHANYIRRALNDEAFWPIMKAIAPYGKPVLMHTSGGAYALPTFAAELAREFRDINFVLGHMGISAWQQGIRAAEEPNVYVDPCCSCTDSDKIEQLVAKVGAEKLLYGSAMMENHPLFTMGMIDDAGLSDAQRELVYHGNAMRLFNLPAA